MKRNALQCFALLAWIDRSSKSNETTNKNEFFSSVLMNAIKVSCDRFGWYRFYVVHGP